METGRSSNDLVGELGGLKKALKQKMKSIEEGLENMLDLSKTRAEERKVFLRKEFGRILECLNYKDLETMNLVKTATLDSLRDVETRAKTIREKLEDGKERGYRRSDLLEYQEKYKNIMEEIDNLERSIELSLAVDYHLLQVGTEEAIYTKSKGCNPKKFRLALKSGVELNPCIFTEPPYSFNNNWIRRLMEINFSSVNSNGSESGTLLIFTASLKDLINAGKATVLNDHGVMLTNLPSTATGYGELDIKILGVHIKDGRKRTFLMENNTNGNYRSFLDETSHRIGLGGLDSSDLVSLDMTTRNRIRTNGNMTNGTEGISGAPKPMGQHCLSVVDEVPEEGKTPDNTIFSPVSDRCQFSTMRETSASQLSDLLASLEHELPRPENDPDSPILAQSLGSGRRSVDDMQRSLSRENSRDNSPIKDVVDIGGGLNKSINFAVRTQIFQELGTPQVKETNKRYSIQEGNTKVKDGIAGVSRRIKDRTAPTVDLEPENEKPGTPDDHDYIWDEDKDEDPVALDSSRFHEEIWETSLNKSMNLTLWEPEEEPSSFNFISGNLELVDTIRKGDPGIYALDGPCFLAWQQEHQAILITEPYHNRVGVYGDQNLDFQGWLNSKDLMVRNPLHILALPGEIVVLIQKPGLYIYKMSDEKHKYVEHQNFPGTYRGLAEGGSGEIISLVTINKEPHISILSLNPETNFYETGDTVELPVTATNRPDVEPQLRNLVYFNNKIYITDMGLSRIYIIDRVENTQTSHGYYGNGVGQFKKPLGLLLDDLGNVLVADNKTAKVMVFNSRGQFVKNISFNSDLRRPIGFLRIGNSILLAFAGDSGKYQGVLRFRFEPATEERRLGSPLNPEL